jgi:DNA modification methylase
MGNSAPTIKVLERAIGTIKPYEHNPRAIKDKAIDKVAASIREFGFQQPIVVDKAGIVIVGHTRLRAAEKLGMKEVPVVVADLPEDKARAYRLADNRTHEETDWLDAMLKDELAALKELDFDLSLTGFDDRELQVLLADEAELAKAEETPEPPVNPVTVEGDVWVLGKHRIVCGDSTNAHVVAKALNGVEPHLMITDPPYGVEYDATWRKDALPDTNPGKTGGMHGKVLNDNKADWREAWALFPGDVLYIWHAGNKAHVVAESIESCGFAIRAQIIWAKHQFVIGRGHYHPHHEPCWYAVRDRQGATGHWSGDRKQSTLWQIDKPKNSETGHSTQKPVECMRRPIMNNSSPGQAVYEPFSGSGTTIIAAEMTGRCCHAIELNPAYVDVAVKRWEQFTGQQATLEGDGRTFEEMSDVRYDAAKNSRDGYEVGIKAQRDKLTKTRAKAEAGA